MPARYSTGDEKETVHVFLFFLLGEFFHFRVHYSIFDRCIFYNQRINLRLRISLNIHQKQISLNKYKIK